jgi:hypothetical protein
MIGVTDVLNKTDGPRYETGDLAGHEIPGRTFFTRFQMKFQELIY